MVKKNVVIQEIKKMGSLAPHIAQDLQVGWSSHYTYTVNKRSLQVSASDLFFSIIAPIYADIVARLVSETRTVLDTYLLVQ